VAIVLTVVFSAHYVKRQSLTTKSILHKAYDANRPKDKLRSAHSLPTAQKGITMQVSIAEAAQRLGVSKDTIKRRIKDGGLTAHRKQRGKSWIWLVETPNETTHNNNTNHQTAQALQELVDTLKTQLEARTREIHELHLMLGQKALEPPRQGWLRKIWPF